MKALIDAIAASIVAEVTEASTWTVEKFDPIWRDPQKGKVLSVYPSADIQGGFRTNGLAEDFQEIVVEYYESVGQQLGTLNRDEAAELAAFDIAESLRTWSLAHQHFTTQGAHDFIWLRTDYAPNVPREGYVRYCRLTFQAKKVRTYS